MKNDEVIRHNYQPRDDHAHTIIWDWTFFTHFVLSRQRHALKTLPLKPKPPHIASTKQPTQTYTLPPKL